MRHELKISNMQLRSREVVPADVAYQVYHQAATSEIRAFFFLEPVCFGLHRQTSTSLAGQAGTTGPN